MTSLSRYTYDLDHRPTAVTDADGNVKSTDYDRDGMAASTTDENGNTTLITLDARGKPSQVQVPFTDDTGTTVYRTTKYTYDQVGNQTTVETPRGVDTATAGDFTAQTTYDALNRVKDQLTPFDPNDPRYNTADRTTRTYDALGRLATVSAPPSAGQTVRNDTTYAYFDNGWTRSSTNQWDITTSYDYNLLGEQTSRALTSAGGSSSRTMTWDYYPDGKLKSRSDDGVPVGAHVVLVDNSDVQNTSAVGTWPASSAAAGFQGFDYQTHDAGTGTNSFTWNLTIPQDGTYQVFVKYPPAAATNAPYTVTDSTGANTAVPVNQSTGDGTWVSIGSFPFTVGGTGQKVTLTDNANGVVAADAVKLVRDNSADTDNENVAFTYDYDPNGNLTDIGDTSPGAAVDDYAITYTGLDQVQQVEEKLAGVVKHTTSYTYDPDSAPLTRTHDTAIDTYTYDVRNLVASVTNATSASDPSPKVTTFAYTLRGQVSNEVKGNGNTVDYTYFLNKALRHQIETKPDGTVVAEHTYDYDPNGNQITDASSVQNADNHAAFLDRTATSTYDPRDRLASLTKTDAGSTVDAESYVHDANNNVVSQTINGTTTDFTFDRNRLLEGVTAGATAAYNYDPFGRLDKITSGGQLLRQNFYDGFDRIIKIQQPNGQTFYSYDPLDRTTSRSSFEGAGSLKETDFTYIGLTNQLADEVTNGNDGTLTKSYQYSPAGQRLSQNVHNLDGTIEDGYYGYNAHSDVEDLTTATGDTKTTYAYTAYGTNDPTGFTGIDPPDLTDVFATPYNVYRFNAKRFDHATGTYDMGFRDYNPGLNQFLTRDTYTGALADTGLTTDPYTNNRYAYGAGNPLNTIENDGHDACDKIGGSACNGIPDGNGGTYTPERTLQHGTTVYSNGSDTYIDGVPYKGKKNGYALAIELDKYVPNENAGQARDRNHHLDLDETLAYLEHFCGETDRPCGQKFLETVFSARFYTMAAEGYAVGNDSDGPGVLRRSGGRVGKLICNCFPAGTKVATSHGAKKIEDIKVGDKVWAKNLKTGKRELRKVVALFHKHADELMTISVAGTKVTVTSKHLFYVPGHGWIMSGKLKVGDHLLQRDGTVTTITAITYSDAATTVYNFEVEGDHDYYISKAQLLVHNCGGESLDPFQVAERISGSVDGHIMRLHGYGTPGLSANGTESKFGANVTPEDLMNVAFEGVNASTYGGLGAAGSHYHVFDTGDSNFGTVNGISTSLVKIWITKSGNLGSMYPVLR